MVLYFVMLIALLNCSKRSFLGPGDHDQCSFPTLDDCSPTDQLLNMHLAEEDQLPPLVLTTSPSIVPRPFPFESPVSSENRDRPSVHCDTPKRSFAATLSSKSKGPSLLKPEFSKCCKAITLNVFSHCRREKMAYSRASPAVQKSVDRGGP